MKNKGFIYIILTIIFAIIVCFFCIFRYSFNALDGKIINKKWYHYDNKTGYYNVFYVDGINLEYTLPGDDNNFSLCNKFVYNKNKNSLNLNCGKNIYINEIYDDRINLTIDSKKNLFFDNIDDSLNYEFESFFSKSISEYKKEFNRIKEIIKIESKRFNDIINSSEEARFVFIGNNCSSIDCVLSLEIIEKWMILSENIYYVDINEFKDEDLINLNKLNEQFSVEKKYYDDVYPRVISYKNNQITDDYLIKCNGFDCSLYETKKYVGDLK